MRVISKQSSLKGIGLFQEKKNLQLRTYIYTEFRRGSGKNAMEFPNGVLKIGEIPIG